MEDEGGGGGGGERMYGMSKVDRIMLKFRPIAPKPVAAGSGLVSGYGADNKCLKSKRKYVRVKKTKNDNSKRRSGEKMKVNATAAVTLPLLPETPDRKENEPVTGFSDLVSPVPVWLTFDSPDQVRVHRNVTKPSRPPPTRRQPQVVSYVTVECVTDTWVDREGLGCTDEEVMMNMEKDTCPGFISDGQDSVVWTNKAYRDMVGVGQLVDEDDITVVLDRKDKWTRSPVTLTYPAFTCKVRVTFAAHNNRPQTPTLTLPCDVWRMKLGTCAWRLDVKAALSLGR